MPTPYHYLRCGHLRSPGVTERQNGPLGLRDDDDYSHWALTTTFCFCSTDSFFHRSIHVRQTPSNVFERKAFGDCWWENLYRLDALSVLLDLFLNSPVKPIRQIINQ